MARNRQLEAAAIATLAMLASVTIGDATTRTATTTIGPSAGGSASVKCPRGQRVVGAYVRSDIGPGSGGVAALHRPGRRRVTVAGYSSADPADLTAIAQCKRRPKSSVERTQVTVPAATPSEYGEARATARCPRGKRIVFAGFRARRDEGSPDYVQISVPSARSKGSRRWTVSALNTHMEGAGTLEAFAYCGRVGRTTARADTVEVGQFETETAEATCPRGTRVRYGGFQHVPGTPGELELNSIERDGARNLRVTASEGFYLNPGDAMGLRAIAYCR